MKSRLYRATVLALVAVILLVACNPATPAPDPTPEDAVAMTALPTATETSAPTSTPTSVPTTPAPTPEVPWELTYGEAWATPMFKDPTTPEPYPVPPSDLEGAGIRSYVVMGSDSLPHRNNANTDAFMLVFVQEINGDTKVTAISFPRDLYVFIPGHGMARINAAFSIGGWPMVEDVVLYNFGIPVTGGYLHMDISRFRQFVDWLGGIDVEVTKNILDECSGDIQLNFLAGSTVHMDGRLAQCYARARMNSNDFDRMRRQQEIVRAIIDKSVERFGESPGETIREVYDAYRESVKTNLNLADWINVGLTGARINAEDDIEAHVIQPPMVRQWTKPTTGAYLLLPNTDLQLFMLEAIQDNR